MLRGESVVVTDFLEFLHFARSTEADPGKIHLTNQLIDHIEALF